MLHGLAQLRLACESDPVANGLTVLTPEIANATTPYQVSPVSVVVTEIVIEDRGEAEIAYHVCTNSPPPMLSCDSIGVNVKPAESFTENAALDGQQLQPTIMTSFD